LALEVNRAILSGRKSNFQCLLLFPEGKAYRCISVSRKTSADPHHLAHVPLQTTETQPKSRVICGLCRFMPFGNQDTFDIAAPYSPAI
jgi:hypothetical protein